MLRDGHEDAPHRSMFVLGGRPVETSPHRDAERRLPDDIADTLRAPVVDGSSDTGQERSLAVLFLPAPERRTREGTPR